ncbi:MAG: photosystem II protein Psb27 [Acaryochloridaceae cyanobacterium RU_4_10]|nr:photosystem II protein Psb27 [Acaryochloridaceae cyanobacterium RU_4_10]
MKRFFAFFLSLALVSTLFLTSCSASPTTGVSGNYRQDTLAMIDSLRTAIELPEGTAEKSAAQSEARAKINNFISQYRRSSKVSGLSSFMTMTTALNGIAGHYASYPNRPIPEKLKKRLDQEFKMVEGALDRESTRAS